jgi:hypothetical protein
MGTTTALKEISYNVVNTTMWDIVKMRATITTGIAIPQPN